jgi:hypothetical protein
MYGKDNLKENRPAIPFVFKDDIYAGHLTFY